MQVCCVRVHRESPALLLDPAAQNYDVRVSRSAHMFLLLQYGERAREKERETDH